MASSMLSQFTVIGTQARSQSDRSLKDRLVVDDDDDDADVCLSQTQSIQLDTSGRSAADRYFWLSGHSPSQQSKEKDGYPTEHSSQAPSCAPQVSAPRYTAQPGGMAYAPQEGVPGYTQRDTVIVTQPGVETSQQQPVPPSHIGLSICSCLCCCWCLGIVAIVYASMSEESANRGDMENARLQGQTALSISVACIILGVIFLTISIAVRSV